MTYYQIQLQPKCDIIRIDPLQCMGNWSVHVSLINDLTEHMTVINDVSVLYWALCVSICDIDQWCVSKWDIDQWCVSTCDIGQLRVSVCVKLINDVSEYVNWSIMCQYTVCDIDQ